MAKKPRKKQMLDTSRLPERMQRHNQLAHKFVNRKKESDRKAARGKKHNDDY